MHRGRLVSCILIAACLAVACSGDTRPRNVESTDDTNGTALGNAGSAGAAAATRAGGAAGVDEARAAAGTTGDEEVRGLCGNDKVEPGEHCDGVDFAGLTCERAGYESGELGCTSDCRLDLSGCSGVELCGDLRDNDGDRQVDCEDPDCRGVCADPCQNPPVLSDPVLLEGGLAGRTGMLGSECLVATGPGAPMIAYQITAAHTGVLDVSVTSEDDLVLSLRNACEPKATERTCFAGARLVEPTREGDAITIVVFGSADADANGRFTLEATSRPVVCGDGYCDPGERCDDGNTRSGDGCSSGCTVETSESGHSGEVPHADPYVVPFVGEIHPADDEDLVEFTVTDPATALVARVLAVGEGACESGELDSVLEILDEDGTPLGIDDDGGAGTCSKVLLPALSAGRYFVRVFAALGAQRATFPYVISLDLDACGNDRISEAEDCDDGNTQGGDGCSALCEVEAGVSARY